MIHPLMVNHDSAEAISQIPSKFSTKVLPAIASILFFSSVEVYAYRILSNCDWSSWLRTQAPG